MEWEWISCGVAAEKCRQEWRHGSPGGARRFNARHVGAGQGRRLLSSLGWGRAFALAVLEFFPVDG